MPPRFLFRFAVEVHRCDPIWTVQGITLDEKYRLPTLADLDSERRIAEVRMAWSPQGLAWWVKVEGKRNNCPGAGIRGSRTATGCRCGSTPGRQPTFTGRASSATATGSAAGPRVFG